MIFSQDIVALVQALMAAAGPVKLVVVLVNGGQLSVDWVKRHCPTVVEAMEGGQSGDPAPARSDGTFLPLATTALHCPQLFLPFDRACSTVQVAALHHRTMHGA